MSGSRAESPPVDWLNIDNIGPAGSINSSVTDMAQWVRMQLGQGTYAGKKILESKTVKEMHTLQMHQRLSETDEKLYPGIAHHRIRAGLVAPGLPRPADGVARRRDPRHAGLGRDDPGEEPRRRRAHQHGRVDAADRDRHARARPAPDRDAQGLERALPHRGEGRPRAGAGGAAESGGRAGAWARAPRSRSTATPRPTPTACMARSRWRRRARRSR